MSNAQNIFSGEGVFIVLEGADGSGKTTQFRLLAERVKAMGYDVEVFDFPRYDQPSSHFVKQYLNGVYGPANSVSPYTASMFYALDRYEAAPAIRSAIDSGKVVLSNRYVGSNMAHQGAKFQDEVEQRGFFLWEDSLEYNLLGIPRPSINIFLKVPAEVSYQLIGQKVTREYTTSKRDEHEADIEHLRKSVKTYNLLTQLFPKDFHAVDCVEADKLLSVPDINNKIWQIVQPLLPPRRLQTGKGSVIRLDKLSDHVISAPKDNIPSKPDEQSLELRLSNISLYAASQLQGFPGIKLTQKLQQNNSELSYYKLPRLSSSLNRLNKESLERLSFLRSELKKHLLKNSKVDKEAISSVLLSITPMSALVTLRISGSSLDIATMLNSLKFNTRDEVKWLCSQLRQAAHGQRPNVFKLLDGPVAKGASKTDDYVSLFIDGLVTARSIVTAEPVQLLSWWPRNEFEVLADSIYPKVNLSRSEIISEIETWSYEQKLRALKSVLDNSRNQALDQFRYRWDILADEGVMKHFFSQHNVKDLQSQPLTARYGYDVPGFLAAAKVDDIFMESFELFSSLFSAVQSAGREDILEYFTLFGHKRRWLFSMTLKDLQSSQPEINAAQPYSSLMSLMNKQLALAHPLIAEHLLDKVTVGASDVLSNKQKNIRNYRQISSAKPLK
ncbi:thymidylate kinase [Candidatus Saccharibacteria bacterium]|nr:thymidylate kinase [Candidatus Saccharibacteria bacterium]